ncbi:methionine biosynthesis protein MetW [Qipengyuania sp. S6317L1]|uniref:methionine biosynthesis protein MetW n=1 Tax=Qipengyuania sp. S6317L1 TaxID=2926410 RepID=UPI001FF20981|nr:methionine biosynthesis protein MetW [Qipengyuania sp. S6317L1]MCK0097905.1 methionine biosynthesis protein MetW [Qipengyuania sp. S6317L1]
MSAPQSTLRFDLDAIARRIGGQIDKANGPSRVLDIGCGDGALMAALASDYGADVRGVELDPAKVERAVSKGLSVIQGDANTDLANYPDRSFNFAVLARTLQTTNRPDQVLEELLRVADVAFVSFPNFAHWRTRAALMFGGRMPVTNAIPISWYETENIHHVTVEDFRTLAAAKGAKITREWNFANERAISPLGANWRAEFALFELRLSQSR